MEIKRSSKIANEKVTILVYGPSGAGKTTLIKTLPSPIILSAEGGLLSISDADLPFIEISKMEDLVDVYQWLTESKEAEEFKSVALDSISEIAEVVLGHAKEKSKDPRQAYGFMADEMTKIIRAFRDIDGRHVYMSAKVEKTQDETGRLLYGPSMPGQKMGQSLPYFFDEVLALRVEKDDEGNSQRAIQTQPDGIWSAKDRSGKLDSWMDPDLGAIIKAIQS